MLVKHNKCYMTKSGNALKVQFVKDHNKLNVEIGRIRPNGKIDWEHYCEAKSLYSEVDIAWIEKELHNNYDVILKYLSGKDIQFKNSNGNWTDVQFNTLVCYLNNELRVKEKPHEYRVYTIKLDDEIRACVVNYSEDTNSKEDIVKNAEEMCEFIGWLTDWTEVE